MGMRQNHSDQAGFTLTELLISSLLGIIVVLGVTNIFVASQVANNLSRSVSDMQQDARFALERIGRSANYAGSYPTFISVNMPSMTGDLSYLPVFTAIPPIITVAGFTTNGVTGDSVAFLSFYENDDSDGNNDGRLDCTNASRQDQYWAERYYLNGGDLFCDSYLMEVVSLTNIQTTAVGGTAVELVTGVANFQVEFGIDRDSDASVNYWTNISSVANLSSVIAVRYWLTIQDEVVSNQTNALPNTTVMATRYFRTR